jgi:hypothetical protein
VVLAFASTLTILSFASRSFAFYYFLQCLVALSVTTTVCIAPRSPVWLHSFSSLHCSPFRRASAGCAHSRIDLHDRAEGAEDGR